MSTGWISVYRTLQEHWLWQEKPFDKARAWIDLLLLVNHKEKKIMFDGRLTTVPRGSKITSLRQLSDRWGWSTKKTKNFLNVLESDGMITHLSDKKKTVVTVVKYDVYQIQGNSEETVEKQWGNMKETAGKPNNNVNNVNNDNNDNKKKSSRFTPPTLEEVQQYCCERKNNIDAERFIDFYATKGWMVGKNKMKDWKAAIRTWEKRNNENSQEVEKDKVEKGVVSSAEPKPTMDPSKFYSDEYINSLPF